MQFKNLSEFGKELQRSFEVHEFCYDCAGFYDGCPAWPAAKAFACRVYDRLPDVMPGTYGQKFPTVSRKLLAALARGQSQTKPEERRPPAPEPREEQPTQDEPPERKVQSRARADGERRCGCGATLAKGKRLCDQCRIQNRRRTMRDYMRHRRGSATVDADSHVPFPAAETPRTHAGGDDLLPTGLWDGSPSSGQTSV